jgi:hypothetical protein
LIILITIPVLYQLHTEHYLNNNNKKKNNLSQKIKFFEFCKNPERYCGGQTDVIFREENAMGIELKEKK